MRLRFGDCLVDLGTREVFRGGQAVTLSPKAFQFLDLLASRRPNAVSKEDLHRGLWPDTFVADGNLANLVNEVRTALGDDAREPRIIRTVPRFGYAFQASAEAESGGGAAPGEAAVFACRLVWGEREIALSAGENLIGREQTVRVWVDDGSVSRHHARIVVDASGASLEDLGSKNGTYLRGRKVDTPAALRDGDDIRLGSVVMTFRRFEEGKSTETLSRQ
jgi:DNA-binding winged helix-turn-helix (wHTH) protein